MLSRRSFLKTAGIAAGIVIAPRPPLFARSGVRLGAVSSSFHELPSTAEEILGYMQTLGLNVIELMGMPAEIYAGAPYAGPPPRHPDSMTQEERTDYVNEGRKAHAELQKWRRSAPMEKFAELGEMFREGGVEIDILKLGSPNWFAEEIHYAYRTAKAVGVRAISFDISANSPKRMGPLASEYGLLNSMHNRVQAANRKYRFDEHLAHSPENMLNLDIGSYVATMGTSPVPVIQQYHDRITHLHIRDCKIPENGQDSVPWETGDTPIAEVLQLLREEAYPIPAMIELDYPIPQESSVMEEMKKCIQYCQTALES